MTDVTFAVWNAATNAKDARRFHPAGVGYTAEGKPVRVARASYTRANFDLDGNVALSGGQHIESWKNSLEVGINNDVPFRIHTGRHGAKNRIQAVMEANEPAVRDVFSNECYPNVKKHTTQFEHWDYARPVAIWISDTLTATLRRGA